MLMSQEDNLSVRKVLVTPLIPSSVLVFAVEVHSVPRLLAA